METQFNGNMRLFKINKIIKRNNFYEFTFYNTNKRLACTFLHSFVDDNGNPRLVLDLKSDDQIWIDVSAFSADKSLYIYNPFGTKGGYVRGMKLNQTKI